ncbi:MAG: Eco57I restriction-modification methylase domain-containing protein [Deltaproteobacteria bacterium]|nr:Eco57I restriction-modification methylase domain-containing protein [Deltaproteobacteria bacterium]
MNGDGAAGGASLLERLGELADGCRARTTEAHRKGLGQFFTSPRIARFLADYPSLSGSAGKLRILDPGAGVGILGVAMAQRVLRETQASVHLVAVEPDPLAAAGLRLALDAARSAFGERFSAEHLGEDFLALDPATLGHARVSPVDLVIANPPYFKVSPSEDLGGDAPNIYARFMEVSSRLLVPGGQLSCIVPRSFTSGAYFERFRRRFFSSMSLEKAHVFDSRRDAFRADGVLQENVIALLRCGPTSDLDVVLSSSGGESDLDAPSLLLAPRTLVFPRDRHASIFFPTFAEDLRTIRLFQGWKGSLAELGLEVSTGPVVPFRCREHLRSRPAAGRTSPMLWMQHVRSGAITWPLGDGFRKPEYICTRGDERLLVPNLTYVILRRFSAKEERRRIVGGVLRKGSLPGSHLGLENHLNFIHRPGGELLDREADALAALLGSELFDRYFRLTSGHTQVNATELRELPLPSLEHLTSPMDLQPRREVLAQAEAALGR